MTITATDTEPRTSIRSNRMSWANSNRRRRLPSNWSAIRRAVFERDDFRCTYRDDRGRCPGPSEEVDHVRHGDDHSLENLRSLCSWHHAIKSGREGQAARRTGPTLNRPGEPHPGLLEP